MQLVNFPVVAPSLTPDSYNWKSRNPRWAWLSAGFRLEKTV
jgi:hypothetical protein